MKFYGNTEDANTPVASPPISIGHSLQDLSGSSGGGGGGLDTEIGKGSIDLGNFLGSVGKSVGNIAKGIGSIGIPGGPNLGGVAALPGEAIGGALGAVGGISLPYLGNDPNRQAAHLGDVPGAVLGTAGTVLNAPEQFVESNVAKARLGTGVPSIEQAQRIAHVTHRTVDQVIADAKLPDDIQARLDAGESVDAIANDMAASGRGFSNDRIGNTVASIVFDPMNLLSFGAGKAITAAKEADRALRAGNEIGVGQRFMGTAYNAASRNLSAGGAALMDHVLGPATSGIFHALGTKPYKAIMSGVSDIAPQYGQAFADAFARGAAQYPRAVIARYLGDEVKAGIAKVGDQVGQTIEARLGAQQKLNPGQLQRRVEELAARVAPDFAGHTDEARFVETRDKLAQITGMSPEDAARALGGKADLRTAQQVHLAFYGKAGDDLARAKAVSLGSKGIDAERLTLVAPDTLTKDHAAAILNGSEDLADAVDKYSILRNRFGNTAFSHSDVRDFIEKLSDGDHLVSTVAKDITGKNALPKALGDWRAEYNKYDYEIGFAPKDGWKTTVGADGQVIYGDPFVHFVSEADPVTMRNPLGRFADSLFRGTTQTSIILDSRNRFVQVTKGSGISAGEARAIHQRILQTAHDAGLSPRGLSLMQVTGKQSPYHTIFRDVLGDSRFAEFIKHTDPDFAVMKAFEGNLSRVGLTQKVTGKVKTATYGHGNVITAVAEGIYPKVRFQFSPLFQVQEAVESPFFNLLRGVSKRVVPEDVAKIYEEMSNLPDFKYLTEAGYVLNLAGNREIERTIVAKHNLIGKALPERFTNVARGKERERIAQVFSEHPDAFQNAVNDINPKLWRTMTDAYGTTDAATIADNFIRERMAIASGNLDEAMGVFDKYHDDFGRAIQEAYANGDTAAGQAFNREAGIARGGTPESGGAMKAPTPVSDLPREQFVKEYNRLSSATSKAEKLDVPFSQLPADAQSAYRAGDWERFSKLRGYSPSEMADYRRWLSFHEGVDAGSLPMRVDALGAVSNDANALYDARLAAGLQGGGVSITHDAETVWQAFRESFRQTSQQAFKTHFFSPERGFLERSINHPYLGLYPASYMWGKVLPEFARFLLVRPFGLNAPLLGLNAYNRVQQSVIAGLAMDKDMKDWVDKSSKDGILQLLDQLLPATPANLPANLPAWERHLAQQTDAGRKIDPERFVSTELGDTFSNAIGLQKTATQVLGAAGDFGDIFQRLTQAANQLDAAFPRR